MTESLKKTSDEIISSLGEVYERYGYSRYKMNKFEEYDLYANNKNFLVSDRIITFTDGNGKLRALKPDVTLSIVKNSSDELGIQKLFYNENVYRVAKGGKNYKEIMQIGLECIGAVDGYCIYEVLDLAAKSLSTVSDASVLCVSHLGIITEFLNAIGVLQSAREEILRYIGEKNLHELTVSLVKMGVKKADVSLLGRLLEISDNSEETLQEIYALLDGRMDTAVLADFVGVMKALQTDKNVKIDFSTVGDIRYYNGFIFKGYVREIPTAVLSGGQYDMLMKKMDRTSRAIGFAVYMDLIEQYGPYRESFVDTVLLYDETTPTKQIAEAANRLRAEGESVFVAANEAKMVKCKRVLRLQNGRLIDYE